MRKKAGLVVFACAAFAVASWGQAITGTVSGTVRDSSGAVLPGVTIQVQNTNTGVGRQADGSRGTVNPQVGQITSTRGNPRQLQFGLRVEF